MLLRACLALCAMAIAVAWHAPHDVRPAELEPQDQKYRLKGGGHLKEALDLEGGDSTASGGLCTQIQVYWGDEELVKVAVDLGLAATVEEKEGRVISIDGMLGVGLTFMIGGQMLPVNKMSIFVEGHTTIEGTYPAQIAGSKGGMADKVTWLIINFIKQRAAASPLMAYSKRHGTSGVQALLQASQQLKQEMEDSFKANTAAGKPAVPVNYEDVPGKDSIIDSLFTLHTRFLDALRHNIDSILPVDGSSLPQPLGMEQTNQNHAFTLCPNIASPDSRCDATKYTEFYGNYVVQQWRSIYTPNNPLESIILTSSWLDMTLRGLFQSTAQNKADTGAWLADQVSNLFSCLGYFEKEPPDLDNHEVMIKTMAKKLMCIYFSKAGAGSSTSVKPATRIRNSILLNYPEIFPGAEDGDLTQIYSLVLRIKKEKDNPAMTLAYSFLTSFTGWFWSAISGAKSVFGSLFKGASAPEKPSEAMELRTIFGVRYTNFNVAAVFAMLGTDPDKMKAGTAEQLDKVTNALQGQDACPPIKVDIDIAVRLTAGASEVGYCTPDTNPIQLGGSRTQSFETQVPPEGSTSEQCMLVPLPAKQYTPTFTWGQQVAGAGENFMGGAGTKGVLYVTYGPSHHVDSGDGSLSPRTCEGSGIGGNSACFFGSLSRQPITFKWSVQDGSGVLQDGMLPEDVQNAEVGAPLRTVLEAACNVGNKLLGVVIKLVKTILYSAAELYTLVKNGNSAALDGVKSLWGALNDDIKRAADIMDRASTPVGQLYKALLKAFVAKALVSMSADVMSGAGAQDFLSALGDIAIGEKVIGSYETGKWFSLSFEITPDPNPNVQFLQAYVPMPGVSDAKITISAEAENFWGYKTPQIPISAFVIPPVPLLPPLYLKGQLYATGGYGIDCTIDTHARGEAEVGDGVTLTSLASDTASSLSKGAESVASWFRRG